MLDLFIYLCSMSVHTYHKHTLLFSLILVWQKDTLLWGMICKWMIKWHACWAHRKYSAFTNVEKVQRRKLSRDLQNLINIPAGLSQYLQRVLSQKEASEHNNDQILNWWFQHLFSPSKLSLEQFEIMQKCQQCYFYSTQHGKYCEVCQ